LMCIHDTDVSKCDVYDYLLSGSSRHIELSYYVLLEVVIACGVCVITLNKDLEGNE